MPGVEPQGAPLAVLARVSLAPRGVVGRGRARRAGKTHSICNTEVPVPKSASREGGLHVLSAQMAQARLHRGD